MAKSKPVLKVVHETARGLRDAGLMDTKTMREFDVLCLPKVTVYTPRQIKRIREHNKASQAVFAAYLNTSVSTVQKWESPAANKHPSGAAAKLLQLLEKKGIEAIIA